MPKCLIACTFQLSLPYQRTALTAAAPESEAHSLTGTKGNIQNGGTTQKCCLAILDWGIVRSPTGLDYILFQFDLNLAFQPD